MRWSESWEAALQQSLGAGFTLVQFTRILARFKIEAEILGRVKSERV